MKETRIRLMVFDVDGVLSDGEAKTFDLGLFELLAGQNRRSREEGPGGKTPGATLCTGRPQPYTEAFMQAVDCLLPAVFEGGAGIYSPREYRSIPHPLIRDFSVMREVRDLLHAEAERKAGFFLQPGKDYTISVFPTDASRGEELRGKIEGMLAEYSGRIEYSASASCLNIQPTGIHKGSGVELLSEMCGIALSDMLGVGDSEADLPFLARVGFAAAPANASAEVKRLCRYVSPYPSTRGARDIYDRCRDGIPHLQ